MNRFFKILFVVAAYAMLAYVLTMDVSAQQAAVSDTLERIDASFELSENRNEG